MATVYERGETHQVPITEFFNRFIKRVVETAAMAERFLIRYLTEVICGRRSSATSCFWEGGGAKGGA
jgi:hypothetical protein